MKHTQPVRRATAWLLSLVLLLCLVWTPASAADTYKDSGGVEYPKLSKQEIAAMMEETPIATPDNLFVKEPSITAPYATGQLTQEALQAATARLNVLRRLAGLPGVELDLTYSQQAQYGAVLLAASEFSHYPKQPADMDNMFYSFGKAATSTSNLAAGYGLIEAVDGFMDDSDIYNLPELGHRRWQLNPTLGRVGFGFTYSNDIYRQYVTEKVQDTSGVGCNYDFIAWPASGYFPARDGNYTFFNGNCAWSVSLNPQKYTTPSQKSVTVTLTRESDGKTWHFSQGDDDLNGKFFAVNNGGYGIPNCIIFRPDGITQYEGWYTVEISGLAEGTLSYQVNFFNTDDADEPDASRYFTDVYSNQWYFDEVEYVYENGIMVGTGGALFEPEAALTRAQAAQLFYNMEGMPSVSGDSGFTDVSGWYTNAVTWASQNGVVAGMGGTIFEPNTPITREQFARMMYNYAKLKGCDLSVRGDLTVFPDGQNVGGWALTAMVWANGAGIINGSDGYLLPGGTATRAQAATMLMQFHQNLLV